MAYHILRKFLTFMRIALVYGSSVPLHNILYQNIPMTIQSLGSNGCQYLIYWYSLIAHSITAVDEKVEPVTVYRLPIRPPAKSALTWPVV